jgi:hypothetical protein
VYPFIALAVLVTLTAASFYGSPHFRTPVDVGMVVLGAIGIDALLSPGALKRGTGSRRTEDEYDSDADPGPALTSGARDVGGESLSPSVG